MNRLCLVFLVFVWCLVTPASADAEQKTAPPVQVAVTVRSQEGKNRIEKDLINNLVEGLGKELGTKVVLVDPSRADAVIDVWYKASPNIFDRSFTESVHARVDGRVLNVELPPNYTLETRPRWRWAGTQIGRDIGVVLKRATTHAASPSQKQIIAQLSERDPAKRAEAAELVGRLGPDAREAIPALLAMLDDHRSLHIVGAGKSTSPSFVAARALLQSGAHAELVSFFQSEADDEARSNVLVTIAAGRLAGSPDLVLGALNDRSRNVRATAARLAGRYVGKPAVPRLIEIVDQLFFPGLREDAHSSLVAIAGQDFKFDANAWRAWWSQTQAAN